jgi:endonuclease-3
MSRLALLSKAKIQLVFERLQAQNPQPTTELIYHSTFELLIAVMLSAQATDIGVNKATAKLFKQANSPEQIWALGEEGLKAYINTIGLYNAKARHVIATCRQLLDRHHGQVPEDRMALEALPGVGRKTANVVLNTAFGALTIAVDTHIFRVANRLQLACGKTVLAVEQQLIKNIPRPFLKNAHHWLILHGRYVCKARKPMCEQCLLTDICPKNL